MRLFRIWALSTMIVSLIYSSLAEIFHFTYDYKYLGALLLGIGLLFKEAILGYYFDVYTWTSKLLERIGDKLQGKVSEKKKTSLNKTQ